MKKLNISPNAYYNYLKERKLIYNTKKAEVLTLIKSIYHENFGTTGYRSMKDILALKNIHLWYSTVYKYMKELGLASITRRKKPSYKKGTQHKVYPNLLNQNFNVDTPNKVWCTDFTYLHLKNGKIRYNCTIIDLFNRSVVSSVNGDFITSNLAINCLEKALKQQKPSKGLILHSDQGSQFTSKSFTEYCTKHNVQQSMNKVGCPYDNAPMERFFNTLKNERLNLFIYNNAEELDDAVNRFALVWYNYARPHTYNNGLPPARKIA